jgi:hypothetical protein
VTSHSRARWAAGLVALGVLAAGCGSAAAPAHGIAPAAAVPPASLDTSVASPAGTWAAVVMGGSAAQDNNFWQLFISPAGTSKWKLITPPGTADNGGLVLAAGGGQSLITAFRPSQLLTFTPLSQTTDAGQVWSAINPLDAAVAATPAAMALQPGGDRLIALTAGGRAEEAVAGSAAWHVLATERTIADTAAGQRCGLLALTAAAWTQSGEPLLAGTCTRPGTVGIFSYDAGTWRPAGPVLPASLAAQHVTAVRLATDGSQTVALVTTGTGQSASVVAAWTGAAGATWTTSPPLRLHGSAPASASFGPDGTIAIITAAGAGDLITDNGASWHALPALPAGTATLALQPGGTVDALAVRAARLTVWLLEPGGGTTWTSQQVINVPIQYGSSS